MEFLYSFASHPQYIQHPKMINIVKLHIQSFKGPFEELKNNVEDCASKFWYSRETLIQLLTNVLLEDKHSELRLPNMIEFDVWNELPFSSVSKPASSSLLIKLCSEKDMMLSILSFLVPHATIESFHPRKKKRGDFYLSSHYEAFIEHISHFSMTAFLMLGHISSNVSVFGECSLWLKNGPFRFFEAYNNSFSCYSDIKRFSFCPKDHYAGDKLLFRDWIFGDDIYIPNQNWWNGAHNLNHKSLNCPRTLKSSKRLFPRFKNSKKIHVKEAFVKAFIGMNVRFYCCYCFLVEMKSNYASCHKKYCTGQINNIIKGNEHQDYSIDVVQYQCKEVFRIYSMACIASC